MTQSAAGVAPGIAGEPYDVVVIGTGPGGEGAAMQASKGGLRVAVVERHTSIGGGMHALGHDSQQGPPILDLPDARNR